MGVTFEEIRRGASLAVADCREALAALPDASVDAIVTDPPYGLEFMGAEWDTFNDTIGNPRWKPREAIVLDEKPADAFGATSHGYRKKNPRCRKCGKLKVGRGACKCATPEWDTRTSESANVFQSWCETWAVEARRVLKPGGHILAFGGTRTYHRLAAALEDAGFEIRDSLHWVRGAGFPKSHNLDGEWQGWGTALKPAHEPIVVGRKPLAGSVAATVQAHGTGAINIDGCRIPYASEEDKAAAAPGGRATSKVDGGIGATPDVGRNVPRAAFVPTPNDAGRWPGNFLLAHTPTCGETCAPGCAVAELDRVEGGASRYFPVFRYEAKVSQTERGVGNNHPTLKPVDLMRWCIRLVTPPGGTVLDPFTGSGSTGVAAMLEGASFLGVERDPAYAEIARRRIAEATGTLPLF